MPAAQGRLARYRASSCAREQCVRARVYACLIICAHAHCTRIATHRPRAYSCTLHTSTYLKNMMLLPGSASAKASRSGNSGRRGGRADPSLIVLASIFQLFLCFFRGSFGGLDWEDLAGIPHASRSGRSADSPKNEENRHKHLQTKNISVKSHSCRRYPWVIGQARRCPAGRACLPGGVGAPRVRRAWRRRRPAPRLLFH